MVRPFLDKLYINGASGIGGISATILFKILSDYIVLPITSIINNSTVKSIFQNALKEAYVLHLHKGAEKADPNNYRPISVFQRVLNVIYLNNY